MKAALFIEAYAGLVRHDLFMRKRDFAALCRSVKDCSMTRRYRGEVSLETICRAVDLSCAFYSKQVLCLQRSAVLVRMLRKRGFPAQLVIGAQKLPFKAHAWVEVNGQIVNDRRAASENFLILEVF